MSRQGLVAVARDTHARSKAIPRICPDAINGSIVYHEDRNPIAPLKRENCPGFRLVPTTDEGVYPAYGTRIEVVNADAYEMAIALSQDLNRKVDPYVAVLNNANADTVGGGWKNGSKAQEEFLCYRSTLAETLYASYNEYPIHGASGAYSPAVAIYKSSHETNYKDLKPPFPMVAVLSVAALSRPKTLEQPKNLPTGEYNPPGKRYAKAAAAAEMREKIRVMLRMAGNHGHTRLVLGAFGCGAFANPNERVAELFLHVLLEEEFSGGWWEHVVFAVKNSPRGANELVDGWGTQQFDIFWRILQGIIV